MNSISIVMLDAPLMLKVKIDIMKYLDMLSESDFGIISFRLEIILMKTIKIIQR